MGERDRKDKTGRRVRLTEARKRCGVSVGELAERLNLSREYIYRVEQGERAPGYDTIVRWADALGITLDDFRPDDPQPQSSAA